MERLNVEKALDEKDAFNDSEQLDISPVMSSGSSSVLSPSTTVTGDQLNTSESLPEGLTDVPCVRKDNVAYPDWSPRKAGTHLQGFWGNTPAGAVIWKIYMPPLK
jgi:hypothetical protein